MQRSSFSIKSDFSDIADFLEECKEQRMRELERIGEEAVAYAQEHGNYRDVSGRLRASNRYEISENGLKLINDAPYAADVEARGKDVLAGAYAYARQKIKQLDK